MYDVLYSELPKAIYATFLMAIPSSIIALLIGLPIGLVLYMTSKDGLFPNFIIHRIFSIVVDSIRAIPFIILAFFLTEVTRFVVGKSIGINAVIFILSIMATPFYARMAEMTFRNIDKGLIEAIRAMGASRLQIIWNVLLPESIPSLVTGLTVTIISIISATSLAGYLSGGGLGDLAIRYGYQRYDLKIMSVVVIVMIILNIATQWLGDRMARQFDHTKR